MARVGDKVDKDQAVVPEGPLGVLLTTREKSLARPGDSGVRPRRCAPRWKWGFECVFLWLILFKKKHLKPSHKPKKKSHKCIGRIWGRKNSCASPVVGKSFHQPALLADSPGASPLGFPRAKFGLAVVPPELRTFKQKPNEDAGRKIATKVQFQQLNRPQAARRPGRRSRGAGAGSSTRARPPGRGSPSGGRGPRWWGPRPSPAGAAGRSAGTPAPGTAGGWMEVGGGGG